MGEREDTFLLYIQQTRAKRTSPAYPSEVVAVRRSSAARLTRLSEWLMLSVFCTSLHYCRQRTVDLRYFSDTEDSFPFSYTACRCRVERFLRCYYMFWPGVCPGVNVSRWWLRRPGGQGLVFLAEAIDLGNGKRIRGRPQRLRREGYRGGSRPTRRRLMNKVLTLCGQRLRTARPSEVSVDRAAVPLASRTLAAPRPVDHQAPGYHPWIAVPGDT